MSDLSPAPHLAPAIGGHRRSNFGLIVTGAVLVVLGGAWLLDALDVVRLRAALILPGLLVLVGLALMIGSFDRPHPGLIPLGVLLTVATVFGALTPPEALQGGVGDRTWVVASAADLRERYEVGVGNLTLDLTQLPLTGTRTVRVAVGAGDLTVIVPSGTAVRAEASVGAGEVIVFDQRSDGLSVRRTVQTDGYDNATNRLNLDLQLGTGTIEVRR